LSPVTIHSQVTDRDVVGDYGRDLNTEHSDRDRQLGADLQPGDWTQGLPTFVLLLVVVVMLMTTTTTTMWKTLYYAKCNYNETVSVYLPPAVIQVCLLKTNRCVSSTIMYIILTLVYWIMLTCH